MIRKRERDALHSFCDEFVDELFMDFRASPEEYLMILKRAMYAVCGYLFGDNPHNASAHGDSTCNSGNNQEFVHQGTQRGGGQRTRFSGINIVYDEEGYEYPIDDKGHFYVPLNEPAVSEEVKKENEIKN